MAGSRSSGGAARPRPARRAGRGRSCVRCPPGCGWPSSSSRSSPRRSDQLCAVSLANPKPGSRTIRSAAIPAADQLVARWRQLGHHVGDDVVVDRPGLHVGAVPSPVHRDERHAAPRRPPRPSSGSASPAAHVVDDGRPGRERLGRPPRRASCRPTRRRPAAASAATTGSTRRSSSATRRALGTGPGRLAADVEDVGALGDQLAAVLDRRRRLEPLAAVAERVGRDVDDAHDHRQAVARRSGQHGPRTERQPPAPSRPGAVRTPRPPAPPRRRAAGRERDG